MNKLHKILCLLIIINANSLFAADKLPASFKHYVPYVIIDPDGHMQGKVYLAPELSKNTLKMGVTKQTYSSKIHITTDDNVLDIGFDSGDSDDPSFTIQINKSEDIASIEGDKLYISAGKTFYVKVEDNVYYTHSKKFHIVDNKIVEVQQPFYYVNKDCTTSTALVMYTEKCGKAKKVAVLPANAHVKVVLAEYAEYTDNTCNNEENNMNMNFLVITPFGLVGWVSTSGGYLQRPGKPLSCIRYIGD